MLGPVTVPATAFVVWVPLAEPPDLLTNTSLKTSGFCQYSRCDLHDDVILIAGVVDGRHLALAVGVIKRVVDLGDRDAEPRRSVSVDLEIGLQALVLLIGN